LKIAFDSAFKPGALPVPPPITPETEPRSREFPNSPASNSFSVSPARSRLSDPLHTVQKIHELLFFSFIF
jgi:hypothetical protein